MKRHAQRVAGITDDELMDRFIRGLSSNIQKEVLRDNPQNFEHATMLAERIGWMDDFVNHRTTNTHPNQVVPMDLDSA